MLKKYIILALTVLSLAATGSVALAQTNNTTDDTTTDDSMTNTPSGAPATGFGGLAQ